MAITVRKKETLKTLEQLEKKLMINTKTGVVDYVVGRHMALATELKSSKKRINELENELSEIKRVIRQNNNAANAFAKMCDQINEEK